MRCLVAVISPIEAWNIPERFVDHLRAAFPQHTFVEAWTREAIREQILDCDVAFTPFVDRDILPKATRLRWIQSPAVGIGHLLYPEMLTRPIVVTSARGVRARSMAEHVMGAMLALTRQYPAAVRFQWQHHWAQNELEGRYGSRIRTLKGARLGIVGLGAIGVELAPIANAFGMRVTGIRRRIHEPVPEGVHRVLPPESLHELLADSDVVVLAAPLTPDTRGLIGARELTLMPRHALLINVGRGRLVDDDALVAALREDRIGGAALDVFTHEPLDAASPYWDLPNVLITPHVSGALEDYWTPLVALFADNLTRFEAGQPLRNVVDKTAGY